MTSTAAPANVHPQPGADHCRPAAPAVALEAPTNSPEPIAAKPWRFLEYSLWCLFVAVLGINVPVFLCMGLDPDALQFDLVTRTAMEGRAVYRDAAENNLPGMVLPLAIVHSILGWSSEALRAVDLLVVMAVCWQLTRLLPSNANGPQRLGLAVALLAFYLSMSEWCHCQRDIWMMLPALAALALRRQQTARLCSADASATAILAAAFAEGLLWAGAFWIKPFVAVPGLVCWLLSARFAWPAPGRIKRKLAIDGGAMLAGGVTAGAAGIAWLMATGAWPAFIEVMFVWNREYAAHDTTEGYYWLCVLGFCIRFFPWVLIHFVAVPVALGQIWGATTEHVRPFENCQPRDTFARTLLAGFYLGWLVQSLLLQHLYDYVNLPPVMLGLAVVASWAVASTQFATKRLVVAFFLFCVIARFPSICIDRLAVWADCVRDGSTPALRDRLSLLPRGSWTELAHVKDFLRGQEVRDGELSCMNMNAISLYGDLNVRPATRFHFVQLYVVMVPGQRPTVDRELTASRQRFMVCDVEGFGMEKMRDALKGGRATPASVNGLDAFPVVFRSGRYVVFGLSGPDTPRWLNAFFKL